MDKPSGNRIKAQLQNTLQQLEGVRADIGKAPGTVEVAYDGGLGRDATAPPK